MKSKFIYMFLLPCLAFLVACEKEEGKVNTTITTITYTAPQNDLSLNLDPASNAVVSFEWTPATTGDYSVVYYKVLFDKESGDFTKPIYIATPTALGTKTFLALSHRELNKIASKAGIASLQTGKLKWKITASNGVATAIVTDNRVIEVKRPAGFAENPADVYVTGAATEGGTDLSKAQKFKKLSDGVFELYTSLTAGTYNFTDNITGTPLTFMLEGTGIKDGTNGASPTTTKKAYRINLDFNTATASLTEIQEVGLWFAGYNRLTNLLVYDANGVWKATNIAIVFSAQSWGKDERYKFRVVEKNTDGSITNKFAASSTKDNVKATGSTAATYYYFGSADNSQWDYTYKFEKEAAKADVLVKFQSSGTYTHQVIYY
ncbi:MAG: hypothetical protein JWP81_4897 [Ferruginibacter sp.]|nr:hypothetical protein [Ferruginibacter sp.]